MLGVYSRLVIRLLAFGLLLVAISVGADGRIAFIGIGLWVTAIVAVGISPKPSIKRFTAYLFVMTIMLYAVSYVALMVIPFDDHFGLIGTLWLYGPGLLFILIEIVFITSRLLLTLKNKGR